MIVKAASRLKLGVLNFASGRSEYCTSLSMKTQYASIVNQRVHLVKNIINISTAVMLTFVLSGCYLGTTSEIAYPKSPYDDDTDQEYCTECASNVRRVTLKNPTGEQDEVKYEVKVKVSYHPYIKWYPSDTKGNMTENGKRAMKQDAENARRENDSGAC